MSLSPAPSSWPTPDPYELGATEPAGTRYSLRTQFAPPAAACTGEPVDQLADSALIELARDGSQPAFAELYTRYFDPVYDFLARMTRNRDEAADITQDTFIKAMNALGGLQKGASFKSWIFTIARNTALNRLERAKRTRPLTFEDDEGEETSFDVIDVDRFGNPEEAADVQATAALVWGGRSRVGPQAALLAGPPSAPGAG